MSTPNRSLTADVVVLGAGTIGTAIAWRCAGRGLDVVLVDPDPERGAWHTAAGMLAPITELHYTESALLRLNLASLRLFPAFAEELGALTGRSTGYRESGTVEVAWDAADLDALRDLHAFGQSLGLSSQLLTGRDLRTLEPTLAPGLPGGLLAASDHQVDPRLLHAALTAAAAAAGVRTVRQAGRPLLAGSRVAGVTLADGATVAADRVVLATGAWSAEVAGPDLPVPVRPVKGQTLRLRLPADTPLDRVVRATVKGSPVYLVPRGDGRVVVGASSEEAGFDVRPRAGAVYELLRDAQTVVPELSEAVLEEVATGLRPGSHDNAPLIGGYGGAGPDGLVLATGHFRNGVLLTPVTADAVAAIVADDDVPEVVRAFAPGRAAVPA